MADSDAGSQRRRIIHDCKGSLAFMPNESAIFMENDSERNKQKRRHLGFSEIQTELTNLPLLPFLPIFCQI